jgi:pilus assembly protein CpaB
MKPKTLILMFVAVGCGLAASFMTSKLLAERSSKEQAEVEKVKILVAKKNLSLGTLIKNPEDLFEERQFTKGEEPKRAIRDFEQLKDKRLNKPITAEQFVSADDLMDKGGEGLAALMAKGMRAFGVKVNQETTAGGFVLPNSRVDVVWVKRGGDNDSQSKIILQNVLVLAVDTMPVRPEDKQAVVASTVTLALRPEQVELLSLASEQGSLRLVLRSFDDEEIVRTTGISPKSIAKGGESVDASPKDDSTPHTAVVPTRVPDVPAPAAPTGTEVAEKTPEPPPAPPKVHVLTIYNGDAVTRAQFQLDDKDQPTGVQIEKSQPEATPARKPEAPAAAPAQPAAPAPVTAPQVGGGRGKTR